jgi:hypothetical protein
MFEDKAEEASLPLREHVVHLSQVVLADETPCCGRLRIHNHVQRMNRNMYRT